MLASSTGTGRWDADAIQTLAIAPDCRSAKVNATTATVGKGVWEALARLPRPRPPSPHDGLDPDGVRGAGPRSGDVVLAVQGNAANASFVRLAFSPPYYLDVIGSSDLGIPAGADPATRLAWASAAYGVAISLSPGATTAATDHHEKAQLQ